jgi:hypothetical protein
VERTTHTIDGLLPLDGRARRHDELARFAARHRPFYEQLYAQRLDVTPWEHAQRL